MLTRGHLLSAILSKYDIACISAEHKVTVKASTASYATSKVMGLRKVGIPVILCFAVVLLPNTITNDFGNLFSLAEAQSSPATAQEPNEVIQTFYMDGEIGSLVSDLLDPTTMGGGENVINSTVPIYVLIGNWSMGVENGEITYFQVDFLMGLQNGTQMQVYSVDNLSNVVIVPSSPNSFPSTSSSLEESSSTLWLSSDNNYSLSIFGYVDVLMGDRLQWQNVPVSINIFNGNAISILFDSSETENRFKDQPVYGIVTDILDANNNPIKPSIWDSAI